MADAIIEIKGLLCSLALYLKNILSFINIKVLRYNFNCLNLIAFFILNDIEKSFWISFCRPLGRCLFLQLKRWLIPNFRGMFAHLASFASHIIFEIRLIALLILCSYFLLSFDQTATHCRCSNSWWISNLTILGNWKFCNWNIYYLKLRLKDMYSKFLCKNFFNQLNCNTFGFTKHYYQSIWNFVSFYLSWLFSLVKSRWHGHCRLLSKQRINLFEFLSLRWIGSSIRTIK